MAAFDVPAELELLYAGFLERNSDKSRQFVREVSRYFVALARRYAWSLPADVRQEVVNEPLLALLSPDAREYDPARGTVKKYLTGFVLNAIRRLREVLYPALTRATVAIATAEERESEHTFQVPTLDEIEAGKECPIVEVELNVISKIDVDRTLMAAPTVVAMALRAVYVEDEPLSNTAEFLGVSRFTLKRRIDAFIAAQRLAEAGRGIYS
jgi:DNA-directed RNA polymerase specialized sigma24 family protein